MTEPLDTTLHPRFLTAPPRRAYAEAATYILDELRKSGSKPGTRLPPERQLAYDLNVSRATIREALAALEIVGAVETRVGAGTFVAATADLEQGAWTADASPSETLEARLVIEPHLAHLAALRWDRRTLAAIGRPVKEARARVASGSSAHPDTLDREFHSAIAAAAANSVIARIATPLWDLMSQALWLKLKSRTWTPELMIRLAQEHERIYTAIHKRDPELASFEMQSHLRRVRSDLFAHTDTEADGVSSEVGSVRSTL
jgi:DNA-binding FadR family transcriptional regulator